MARVACSRLLALHVLTTLKSRAEAVAPAGVSENSHALRFASLDFRRRQFGWRSPAGARPVRVRPSRPLGSECCVSRGNDGHEAYTAIALGCVIEPRNRLFAGVETVEIVERNTSGTVMRGAVAPPGSKSTSRAKGLRWKLGDPASGQLQEYALVRIGKVRSRIR